MEIASCGDWSPNGQYDGYSPGLVEQMGPGISALGSECAGPAGGASADQGRCGEK